MHLHHDSKLAPSLRAPPFRLATHSRILGRVEPIEVIHARSWLPCLPPNIAPKGRLASLAGSPENGFARHPSGASATPFNINMSKLEAESRWLASLVHDNHCHFVRAVIASLPRTLGGTFRRIHWKP